MKKTYKIVMLPTDNEKPFTGLVKINSVKPHLGYGDMNNDFHNADHIHPQHLYIISDQEIKEGDWCIMLDSFGNVFSNAQQWLGKGVLNDGLRKIISSTDKDITPNSFIHESFIPVYIKAHNEGKQITEVELEIETGYPPFDYEKGIKTNPDGSVIISLKEDKNICIRCGQSVDSHLPEKYLCPEEKMYTKDELEQAWCSGLMEGARRNSLKPDQFKTFKDWLND